ncbi:MAG TPA: DUF2330 domain-containing protein [Polyangiaceae bacterium]|nr:DUF2330 domain-containing protein [Polyangiaceae bacterium]
MVTAVVLGVVLQARPASACGGLFCSSANLVNQAAERIVFAQDQGTTTAVIEINYQGPASRFSWVLPVPGVPEVSLSSSQALNLLQNRSDPQYIVNTHYSGNCQPEDDYPYYGGSTDASAPSADAGSPGVSVLASGSVGPYDFSVIQIDAQASEPVKVMIDWLKSNHYDVSLLGQDLLGEYVAQGMNFLAVRLNKSANAGAVRPVMIKYQSTRPVIPIRPTSVAANPDMGVMVWVLGASRAVPVNYRSLELNDALIDWFYWYSNYNDVVTEAANEAGGHGFVTQYAGDPSITKNAAWGASAEGVRAALDNESDPQQLLLDAAINFGTLDGFADVVTQTVPLPAGVSAEQFMSCFYCYLGYGAGGGDAGLAGFDKTAFLTSLDSLVIDPMRKTQELFDNAGYVTRLYTTLSPDEMTVDPEFDFNSDLGDVSNVHEVDQAIQCADGGTSWSIDLPSGLTVFGTDPTTWPVTSSSNLPANLRIWQYSTSGQGQLITDNSRLIPDMIGQQNLPLIAGPNFPTRPGTVVGGSTSHTGSNGGSASNASDAGGDVDSGVSAHHSSEQGKSNCGCRVVGNAAPGGGAKALWLSLLGLALMRRRKA